MKHPLAKYVIASVDGLWLSYIAHTPKLIMEFSPDWTKAVRIPTASIPYVRADYEKMRESCESPTIVFTDGYNFI